MQYTLCIPNLSSISFPNAFIFAERRKVFSLFYTFNTKVLTFCVMGHGNKAIHFKTHFFHIIFELLHEGTGCCCAFEDIELNKINPLTTTRLVASSQNENSRITNLPKNRSSTLSKLKYFRSLLLFERGIEVPRYSISAP